MSARGLTLALIVSAALNVFVIGAAAGLAVVGALGRGGMGAPVPASLRAASARLDPADRAALVQVLRDQFDANGPVLLDARQARREARRLMLVEPFDPTATAAALARARADDLQVRGRLEDAVVAFAAKLSPQERAALSDGIMHAGSPRGPRGGFLARLGSGSSPPPAGHP